MDQPRRMRGTPWIAGTGRAVTSLARFDRGRGPTRRQAVQAGIAFALPILIGGALGRVDLGLLAASGSFTSLYGQRLVAPGRLRVLGVVGPVLTGCALLGGLAGVSPVLTAVGLVAVALLATAVGFSYTIGAPGPMFAVLTFGLASHACRVVEGHTPQSPWVVAAAIAAGASGSCLVAATDLLLPSVRAAHRSLPRGTRTFARTPIDRDGRELFVRIAIVAVVGTAVSMSAVDPDRAYWVVGAGLAVVGARPGRGHAASRALHRILGTVVGAGLYVVVSTWVELTWITLALLLGTLQMLVQLVVARNYALALVFVTPLVLTLTGAAIGGPAAPEVVWERVLDTIVGGLLGGATGLVHRPGPRTLTGAVPRVIPR